MTTRQRHGAVALATVLLVAAALAACSSSDDSSTGSERSTTTAPRSTTSAATGSGGGGSTSAPPTTAAAGRAAALPDDACAVLAGDEDTAVLTGENAGVAGPGSTDPSGPQFVSCQWGDLTTDTGQLSVAVSRPSGDGGIDYLSTLMRGTGATGTPSPVGTDGKVVDLYVRPGGGGVGRTVWFTKDGLTVLVGRSGDAVDTAALETAAGQVAGRL